MQKMIEISQPSPPNMDAIYLEASGGEKKRRVYGLGSQASSLYPESYSSGATSAPPPPSAATIPPEIMSEMDGMKKKMVELEQQNQNLIQQNQRMCRQMRREWRQMRMMMQSGLLPSGPGQSSQHQEQDEEQDDKNDDDDDDDDLDV